MQLIVERLSHTYRSGQSVEVLQDISFQTGSGHFLAIVGPSGCGKTTLLKLMAGALPVQSGAVSRRGDSNNGDSGGTLLVRQEHALFPWMTALDNACFGLKMRGVARTEREQRALELFERFGLRGFDRAFPHQLSAGMKQRVALIRAFVSRPAMLLMDEPFAALDPPTRSALHQELLTLCARWTEVGVVFVTHDVDEAIALSDRVLVFSRRPASIVADVKVPMPRPRTERLFLDPSAIALKAELLGALHAEFQESRA